MLTWVCIECQAHKLTSEDGRKPKCPRCGGAMRVKRKKSSPVHGVLADKELDLGLAILKDSQKG